VQNLAAVGVATEDAIIDFDHTIISPIRSIMKNHSKNDISDEVQEEGFEVIEHRHLGQKSDELISTPSDNSNVPLKRTSTWTY